MTDVLSLWLYYAVNLLVFMLLFWIWVPGFLISAVLTLRYRRAAAERLLRGHGALGTTLWSATLLGVTGSASRRTSLQAARVLQHAGVSAPGILAYLIASHSLVLYFLAVLTLLLGIEFAVGQGLAGLFMIGWVGLLAPRLRGVRPAGSRPVADDPVDRLMQGYPAMPSLVSILLTPRGWWAILRYIGLEARRVGINTLVGILLAGLILAAGLQPGWPDLTRLGGGGLRTDLLHALLAPILSGLLWVPPLGNLPLAMALFKTEVLTYPGLVGFVLASLVHPPMLRAYGSMFGRRHALRLTWMLLLGAMLAGLVVTWLYGSIDFRPGLVPVHPLQQLWHWWQS